MVELSKERWQRQYQILSIINQMINLNLKTIVRDITDFLLDVDCDISINIINSAVRHYGENRLLKRGNMQPYKYILTKKGYNQLEWLKDDKYLEYLL